MPVGKRNVTAAVVDGAWEVEKGIGIHFHAEVRPTDAFLIHIHKDKCAFGHQRGRYFHFLVKYAINWGDATSIRRSFPPHVTVHSEAADARTRIGANGYRLFVSWANVHLRRLKIIGEERIAGIKEVNVVGAFHRVVEGALDPG